MGKRKGMKLARLRALADAGLEDLEQEVKDLNMTVENLKELLRKETVAKEEVQQKLTNVTSAPAKQTEKELVNVAATSDESKNAPKKTKKEK